MIIAGIDEAGYGPLLGPLSSAACAFETPDADPLPDLWACLKKAVSRKKSRDGRTLHVNDSKAVYSPSAGLAELERAVLCLAEQATGPATSADAFLAGVDPDVSGQIEGVTWYRPAVDEIFPLAVSEAARRIAFNAFAACCKSADTRCVHYRLRLMPERQFNDITAKTKNKASTLFSLAGRHLDDLIRKYADQNLLIVCDRHGGRSRYGGQLRMMFEDWSLVIVSEADACSEYELHQAGRRVRITFLEKAETDCLSVAAASMLAKYGREVLMRRFNAFWRSHDQTLKPTAGYYTDGVRFLKDIAPLRRQLNIADVDLIRER